MRQQTIRRVNVVRHTDGVAVGRVDLYLDEWQQYQDGVHQGFQWPEGIAEAGDCLSEEQMDALGLDPRTVIYLD